MNKIKEELKNSGSAYDNNTGRNVSFNQTGTSTSSNKQSESKDNISNSSDDDKYRQQGKTSRPRVKARVSEIDNDAMNFATAMANAEMTRTSVKIYNWSTTTKRYVFRRMADIASNAILRACWRGSIQCWSESNRIHSGSCRRGYNIGEITATNRQQIKTN